MPFPRNPAVSLIIPVHNGGPSFGRCIDAVRALQPPPDEWLVVADGCADGSATQAEEAGARVLTLSTTRGPAAARNAGARTARGEVLLFLDADVLPPPDLITRVRSAVSAESGLTAVIGAYDDRPDAGNFLSQYRNLLHHYVHQTSSPEASTFWGACGAIRAEAFRAVGGFDEQYGAPSVEDIELGYRLRAAGYAIRLLPDLQVRHLKRWDAGSLLRTDISLRALPWTALILREGRLIDDLNLTVPSRCSGLLASALPLFALGIGASPAAAAGVLGCAAGLLLLNLPFYRFLRRRRGVLFTLRALPWHWLYYLYSSAAFAVGCLRAVLASRAPSRGKLKPVPEPNRCPY